MDVSTVVCQIAKNIPQERIALMVQMGISLLTVTALF